MTATKEAGREQHLLLLEEDTSVSVCAQKQPGVEDEYIFQKPGAAQQLEYLKTGLAHTWVYFKGGKRPVIGGLEQAGER